MSSRIRFFSASRSLSLTGLIVASFSIAGVASAADVSAIDPCGLVTKQEAQAAVGEAVATDATPPARINKDNVRICSIRGTNGKGLLVFVGAKNKAGFDREKKGQTTVTGIGDDAYTNPMGIVALRKGEIVVTLSPTLNGLPDNTVSFEKVKSLARAAAGRI
jgi:hypothetical protein